MEVNEADAFVLNLSDCQLSILEERAQPSSSWSPATTQYVSNPLNPPTTTTPAIIRTTTASGIIPATRHAKGPNDSLQPPHGFRCDVWSHFLEPLEANTKRAKLRRAVARAVGKVGGVDSDEEEAGGGEQAGIFFSIKIHFFFCFHVFQSFSSF